MLKKLRNFLITGLLVVLPTGVTLYLLWWLFKFLDGLLGRYIMLYTGYRVPGLGLLALFLLLLLAGLFTRSLVGRAVIGWWEKIVLRVPLAGAIYGTVKQTLEVIWRQEEEKAFRRVVLFEYPRKGVYALGFVTGEAGGEFLEKTGKERLLNVLLLTTPNPATGFLLFVPAEDVLPLEMSVEDGLKMIVSGGIVTPWAPPAPGPFPGEKVKVLRRRGELRIKGVGR